MDLHSTKYRIDRKPVTHPPPQGNVSAFQLKHNATQTREMPLWAPGLSGGVGCRGPTTRLGFPSSALGYVGARRRRRPHFPRAYRPAGAASCFPSPACGSGTSAPHHPPIPPPHPPPSPPPSLIGALPPTQTTLLTAALQTTSTDLPDHKLASSTATIGPVPKLITWVYGGLMLQPTGYCEYHKQH